MRVWVIQLAMVVMVWGTACGSAEVERLRADKAALEAELARVQAELEAVQTIPIVRAPSDAVQAETLTLSLTAEGTLFRDGEETTEEALAEHIDQSQRELRAVIAADGSIPHADVVALIDLLRIHGVTKYAINVRPGDAAE
ncbi:MAG: biopolymer transporter ExbD [Myxococcota bacterium]